MVSDSQRPPEQDSSRPEPSPDGVESIETYETDGGVVLYDAENPLAWVESADPLRLDDCA